MNSMRKLAQRGLPAARRALPHLATVALVLALPTLAHASSTGGSLPWEGPIDTFVKSIKGPVAYGIALLGVVGLGASLLWGGELNQFLRGGIMLICAIALIVGAAGVLSGAFGVGAVIAMAGAAYGA